MTTRMRAAMAMVRVFMVPSSAWPAVMAGESVETSSSPPVSASSGRATGQELTGVLVTVAG